MSKRKLNLQKNREMTSVSIRIPIDVIDQLKQVAPVLGFSGYQPLIKHYVGQGLRRDLKVMETDKTEQLARILIQHGIDRHIISDAMLELEPANDASPLKISA